MRSWIVSAAMLIAASACGSLPAEKPTKGDTSAVKLSDPRFSGVAPTVYVREPHCGHREDVIWSSAGGVAQIQFLTARSQCTVDEPVRSDVDLAPGFPWLKRATVRFEGEPVAVGTPLGMVWGRRFKRNDRECFFFRHGFEPYRYSFNSQPTAFIVGFFCGPEGQSNSDASIRQFMTGLSVGDEPAPTRAPAAEPVAWSGARTIPFAWEGVTERKRVTFTYSRQDTTGSFLIADVDGAVDCNGHWSRDGDWATTCSNGRTMSGQSFRVEKDTIFGTGKDDLGRGVRIGGS
jgi:hypothetical protein